MFERETIISLEELTGIELRCTKCQSASFFATGKEASKAEGPVHCCPYCRANFEGIMTVLGAWQQLLRENPSFRLKFHINGEKNPTTER